MNHNIKVNGTINRNCERCKLMKECNCFEIEGNPKVMCDECMAVVYGYGKEVRTVERIKSAINYAKTLCPILKGYPDWSKEILSRLELE